MRKRVELRPQGTGGPKYPQEGGSIKPAALKTEPLTATPAQMVSAAEEVAGCRAALGGPDLTSPEAQPIVLNYDDGAPEMAGRVALVLEGDTQTVAKSGVTPQMLHTQGDQLSEARRVCLTAEQLEADVDDSLAVVGRRTEIALRRICRQVHVELDLLPVGSPARRQLESDAAELLQWEAAQKARAQKTNSKNEKAQARAAAEKKSRDITAALADAVEGETLDPETEADLVNAYAEERTL